MKIVIANHEISSSTVRLVHTNGTSEVMSVQKAMIQARDQDLDLVQVSDGTGTPIVKIMSLNKYKYELQQNEKNSRKTQRAATIQQKEIQFKVGIHENDLNVKLKNASTFLSDGKHVRMVMRIQGRRGKTDAQAYSMNYPFFEQVLQKLGDIDIIQKVMISGNNLHCVVKSKKR